MDEISFLLIGIIGVSNSEYLIIKSDEIPLLIKK